MPASSAWSGSASTRRRGSASTRRSRCAGRARCSPRTRPWRPASDKVAATGPARIWEIRRLLRERLVEAARQRLRASWRQRGASDAELGWTQGVLEPGVLTVGFARRVPSYKRLTLMLHDPDRLRSLLLDPERPVQVVIAGKAHPADESGKQLIQQMVRFADDPAVRHRIVFLPDYDMELAHALVLGCDVWLNNPLRPLEACGTSGMKAALNGGVNLSVLDGWWPEACRHGQNGWAIGDRDDTDQARELDALYGTLEREVLPAWADRARWLAMMEASIATVEERFSAERMVREYFARLYAL